MEHEQLVSHIFGVNIAADVVAVIVTVATTAAVVVVVAAITTQIYIYVRCRFECDVMVIMWVWHAIWFLFGFLRRAYLHHAICWSNFCAARSFRFLFFGPILFASRRMWFHMPCHANWNNKLLGSACVTVFVQLIQQYTQTESGVQTQQRNEIQCNALFPVETGFSRTERTHKLKHVHCTHNLVIWYAQCV